MVPKRLENTLNQESNIQTGGEDRPSKTRASSLIKQKMSFGKPPKPNGDGMVTQRR